MKQLGNLALVCAKRPEVLLQIYVYVGEGPERAMFSAAWDNDEELCRMIHELNFGRYRSSQAA